MTGRGRRTSRAALLQFHIPFLGGSQPGSPASRDLGKRVLRKPLQSGRACSPGEVAARGAAGGGVGRMLRWGQMRAVQASVRKERGCPACGSVAPHPGTGIGELCVQSGRKQWQAASSPYLQLPMGSTQPFPVPGSPTSDRPAELMRKLCTSLSLTSGVRPPKGTPPTSFSQDSLQNVKCAFKGQSSCCH